MTAIFSSRSHIHFSRETTTNSLRITSWNLIPKLLISKLTLDDVQDFQNGAIQINAYKTDKPFKLQPSLDVKLKVDPVKFYKLHTFRENDFFDEDALVMSVVENGVPMKRSPLRQTT